MLEASSSAFVLRRKSARQLAEEHGAFRAAIFPAEFGTLGQVQDCFPDAIPARYAQAQGVDSADPMPGKGFSCESRSCHGLLFLRDHLRGFKGGVEGPRLSSIDDDHHS